MPVWAWLARGERLGPGAAIAAAAILLVAIALREVATEKESPVASPD